MELKKLILAPMAGVADGAMRTICMRHGAEFTVTEMVSAAAVYYKDKKTYRLAEITQAETPCAVQVFGHDPDIVAYAITALYEAAKIKPAAFDVNMGCPVKKVVRGGDGSALMRDIRLAERIISAAVKVSPVPVTVKMRAGFDKDSINAPELAKAAEAAGASALCVHGRTREDMYKQGTVRRGVIADVVKAVNIPVAANGDIFTAEDALSMLDETGAAVGETENALYDPSATYNRFSVCKNGDFVLRLIVEEKGEKAGIPESRKHAAWYLKGMRGAAWARQTVNTVSTEADMIKILDRVSEGLTV